MIPFRLSWWPQAYPQKWDIKLFWYFAKIYKISEHPAVLPNDAGVGVRNFPCWKFWKKKIADNWPTRGKNRHPGLTTDVGDAAPRSRSGRIRDYPGSRRHKGRRGEAAQKTSPLVSVTQIYSWRYSPPKALFSTPESEDWVGIMHPEQRSMLIVQA